MSRWLKLLIGLLFTLAIAWLSHGPLGRGAAYVDLLQQRAEFVISNTVGPPGIQARVSRAPLSRTVFMCGVTNSLQRGGIRDYPGYDERMRTIGGISSVVWDPAPGPNGSTPPCRPEGPGSAGGGIPLLLEILGLAAFFWLIGLGLGWVFRRRPPRTGYLS